VTETGASAGAAGVKPVARKRTRIFYLDLVRALAALLIVLTHFNNPYLADGGYVLTNFPFGIYVGGLGVSLFLIISGAALTVTYRRPINLKRFYWKRCLNIYPMFWTAWILATLYFFVTLYNELEGHCGVVLCATQYLDKRLVRGLRSGRKGYEEVYSRIGRQCIQLSVLSPEDISLVCVANGITGDRKVRKIADEAECDLRRVRRAVWREHQLAKED